MKMKKVVSLLAIAMAVVLSTEGALASVNANTLADAVSAEDVTLGTPVEVPGEEHAFYENEETVSSDGLGESIVEEATYTTSGSSLVAKMSKNAISNNLNTIYSAKFNAMNINPSLSSPYSPGTPSDEHMKYALASVNLMRQIAGLPGVTLNNTYSSYAQHGSVLMAVTGKFQHNFDSGDRPADMDTAFFETGRTGTGSSNISMGTAPYYTMPKFTTGYMQDNSGSNVLSLGHRRWILNPKMGQTGFGYVVSPGNTAYSAMYAFDKNAADVDYDFIAWPSSGNFPNTLMSAADPWSITLNPDKFKATSLYLDVTKISVTVTAPNGTVKTFTAADNARDYNNKSNAYFAVNTQWYGIPNCIIFRPGTDTFGSDRLSGTYTVVVSGLQDDVGAPAGLCYTVDFFDPQDYISSSSDSDKKVDENAIRNFVTRMYDKCLNRAGDAEGILYWTEELTSGKMTGAKAAQGFFFSTEMENKNLTDKEFVEVLYNVLMDRTSDTDGMNYWLDLLDDGMSRTWVFSQFATSKEYTNICNSYGITRGEGTLTEGRDRNYGATQFISRLYTKALGRTYDVEGLNYWCDCLLDGQFTAAEIATTQFFHSQEFRNKNLGDKEYLEVLYRTFLDREYDKEGMEYWLKEMRVNGMTRDEVLYSFANSKEFKAIMAKYGL